MSVFKCWIIAVAAFALAGVLAAAPPSITDPVLVAQMGVTPAPTPEPTKPPHTRPESGKEPLGDPSEAHDPAPQ